MITQKDQAFLITLKYEGPWERLMCFCYGIRRADNSIRWDIPENPRGWRLVMGWLGDFCDKRDMKWRDRRAKRGTRPRARWKRSAR